MLDRADRSIVVFWVMFWVFPWLEQRPWLAIPDNASEGYPGQRPLEYVRVPRLMRLAFGLLPNSRSLRLRPAIAQGLALTMAIIDVAIKHHLNIPPSSRILEMMAVSLLMYFLVVIGVSVGLDAIGKES